MATPLIRLAHQSAHGRRHAVIIHPREQTLPRVLLLGFGAHSRAESASGVASGFMRDVFRLVFRTQAPQSGELGSLEEVLRLGSGIIIAKPKRLRWRSLLVFLLEGLPKVWAERKNF
jgi:hypothetical protein